MIKAPTLLLLWALALSGVLREVAAITEPKTMSAVTKRKSMVSEQSAVSSLSSRAAASQDKFKVFDLAEKDITAYLVSFGITNGGDRRAQSTACDYERDVLGYCIPSEACANCFNNGFDEALDQEAGATCWELEGDVCLIAPYCACGCEAEAEAFYRCVLQENTNCDLEDCNRECVAENNVAFNCLGSLASSCLTCVGDSIQNLFAGGSSVTCSTFDSKVCTAIHDLCGCGSCADEVEGIHNCYALDTDCLGLDCPVGSPNPPPVTPVPPPAPTTNSVPDPAPSTSQAGINGGSPFGGDPVAGEPSSAPAGASCHAALFLGLAVIVVAGFW